MNASLHSPIKNLLYIIGTLLCLFAASPAWGDVIDRIQINQAGSEAEIQIRFVTRIQYLRQVMLKNGDIRIYLNLLEIDPADSRLVWQKQSSPPSNIAPRFSVTYPELDSSLSISFGKFVDYRVRPGNDGRSISVFVPAAAPIIPAPARQAPGTDKPSVPVSPAEIAATEQTARQLMDQAIAALKNNATANEIDLLKQLLNLPPNQQTQIAQYLLGQAYERNKEFSKARDEYDAYIRRYPKADNLGQVKESLARVFMAAYLAEKPVPEQLAVSDNMVWFGSFFQNYYQNALHTDSAVPPSTAITSTVDSDQSQLLSSLDLTGLKRSESHETRLVLRDSLTANFLPDIGNSNLLDAAYVEQNNNDQSRFYGAGRQVGISSGMPSRFDGGWLVYNLSPAWHVKGSLGSPVIPGGFEGEIKNFAALSVELTRQPGQWSGNAYWIGQRVADVMDRRAVGIEAHYSDALNNHMGLFEYDTLFRKLNVGLIQGNWTTAEGANYNLRIDHRKHLLITNALLLGAPPQSIEALRQSGATTDQLMTNALTASPFTNVASVGLTQPYSPRLKLGGDIILSNTTGYTEYDPLQNATVAFPRAWAHTYSAQVIGNNLVFDNDLGVAKFSYTHASTYNAEALTFSQATTFLQNWQLNILLQLYAENNIISGYMMRLDPSFKLGYQASQTLRLEVGGGLTHSDSSSAALDSKTHGKYFNFSYRKNF